jgi:hypothetical protein
MTRSHLPIPMPSYMPESKEPMTPLRGTPDKRPRIDDPLRTAVVTCLTPYAVIRMNMRDGNARHSAESRAPCGKSVRLDVPSSGHGRSSAARHTSRRGPDHDWVLAERRTSGTACSSNARRSHVGQLGTPPDSGVSGRRRSRRRVARLLVVPHVRPHHKRFRRSHGQRERTARRVLGTTSESTEHVCRRR